MYVGALIMMVGTPLALDSYWGLIAIAAGLLVPALRILDEEKMLRQELAGSTITCRKSRFVWCHTCGERLALLTWKC